MPARTRPRVLLKLTAPAPDPLLPTDMGWRLSVLVFVPVLRVTQPEQKILILNFGLIVLSVPGDTPHPNARRWHMKSRSGSSGTLRTAPASRNATSSPP